MDQSFEVAAQANKIESLLWNLYAYCLWKSNQREKAIQILNQALQFLSSDERTQHNLQALQNNRKMKMRSWNMMWYQFQLDKPPMQKQMQQQMRYR